jgi:2-methylcitrate dehydratase PrpD
VTETTDLTGLVVRTAHSVTVDDVPPSVLHGLKLAILDLLACCVAGSRTEGSVAVADWAQATGPGTDSVIIGTALRATPPMGALANGAAGHALDYDDVSMRMIHPSVNLVPALLGAGEPRGVSGRDFLQGYLAGFEVQARICREINPEHYDRGWHSTGTVGPLGAAMAVARLYGLDEERSRWALGIAASSAGSIRKNFGSMVKPLHPGQAAYHGLQAADLAARGFTGDRSVLEGKNGFLQLFSNADRLPGLYEAFADGAPFELVESGIALKRFACCGAIHSAQDALLDLLGTHAFSPDQVARIECRVNTSVPNILVHHVTQSGLEGKFSMEYSLAVCLLDRWAGLAQYTADRAADPALLPLMRRVDVVVDDSIPVNMAFFPSIVTVTLDDGRRLTERVDVPVGYPSRPLSQDQVTTKARDCCAGVLEDQQFDDLVDVVTHLEDCPDIGVLGAALSSSRPRVPVAE